MLRLVRINSRNLRNMAKTPTRPMAWGRSFVCGSRSLHLEVSDEVREAIVSGQPVVALESTIISHGGLPFPLNLELGRGS